MHATGLGLNSSQAKVRDKFEVLFQEGKWDLSCKMIGKRFCVIVRDR